MSYDAPPPPMSPYGGYPQPAPAPSSTGTWALVCGIVGLLCCCLPFGIPAVVLGRQAQSHGRSGGVAQAGEILGYLDLALFVIFLVLLATGRVHFYASEYTQPN
jgi:uncharacterized membrane protein YtjA (UPF0391 family)